jgi:hypothetical protein
MLLQNETIRARSGFYSIPINEISMIRSVEVISPTEFFIRATPTATAPTTS